MNNSEDFLCRADLDGAAKAYQCLLRMIHHARYFDKIYQRFMVTFQGPQPCIGARLPLLEKYRSNRRDVGALTSGQSL